MIARLVVVAIIITMLANAGEHPGSSILESIHAFMVSPQ
jgi:hypothetical protein